MRYLRGQSTVEHTTGHNPLGAGSVLAMLLFLLLQVGTGLVSDDEIATSGPLTRLVSSGLVSQATAYHTEVGKVILLVLIALHVAAILFYFWRKRENLVRPMLLGDKVISQPAPVSRDDVRTRILAALLLALSAGMVALMLKLAA
jgi:cytochrome b